MKQYYQIIDIKETTRPNYILKLIKETNENLQNKASRHTASQVEKS